MAKYQPMHPALTRAFTGGFSELRDRQPIRWQRFTSYKDACDTMAPRTDGGNYLYATFLPDGRCWYVGKAAGRGGFGQRYAFGYGHLIDLVLETGGHLFGAFIPAERDIDDAERDVYDRWHPIRNRRTPTGGLT